MNVPKNDFYRYRIGSRIGEPTTGASELPAKRPNARCVVRGETRLTGGVIRLGIACLYANQLKLMYVHVVR